MIYKFDREEKEEVIRKLAEQYPRTFFENPKTRVPLMKNVVARIMGLPEDEIARINAEAGVAVEAQIKAEIDAFRDAMSKHVKN
jgi:hypothetical protein